MCRMLNDPEKTAGGWTEELVEEQVREDLDSGRVYRLNDRFFKFLFGGADRKHLFLDLVNALVFPDGSTGFTGFEYTNRELSSTREDGKSAYLDIVAKMADGSQVQRSRLRRSIDLHSCPAFSSSIARQLMKQLSDQHSSLRFAGCLLMCRVST